MPSDIGDATICTRCPHGVCVSYIREQSKRMKDRDTQYRLAQSTAMACYFESGVPGFSLAHQPDAPIGSFIEAMTANSLAAGTRRAACHDILHESDEFSSRRQEGRRSCSGRATRAGGVLV